MSMPESQLEEREPLLDDLEPIITAAPAVLPGTTAPTQQGVSRRWREIVANRKVAVGLAIIAFFVLLALVGPFLLKQSPTAIGDDLLDPPSAAHWLGTTQTGQDVLAQVIVGTRISLLIGFGTAAIATLISVIIGLAAGYFGGIVDDLISMLINIFLVIPSLPLAIVMAAYVPIRGPLPVAIVIIITGWAWGARVLRAQTLSLRSRDFIAAAQVNNERAWRIIFAEILPNVTALVAASFINTLIYAIVAEASLEFLGLGDVTTVSWGTMFYWAQNNGALLVGAWWWFVAPGFCVAMLGTGLALVNFGIDEIANPRLRVQRRHKQKVGA